VGLTGSLAPKGALLKRAAATPALLEHTGRAVVFTSLEDLASRIDDPGLEVVPDDVLVLQNAGPKSPAAMPEAGYLPIPRKLAQQGVTDMVRISDARMSGTAYGTVVLHVTPETVDGGPLALVRTGDLISLSASARRIDLLVDDRDLQVRRKNLPPAPPAPERGYDRMFVQSILSAPLGCDFEVLQPQRLVPLR
jgi:dihydroxy-acid dehydratase